MFRSLVYPDTLLHNARTKCTDQDHICKMNLNYLFHMVSAEMVGIDVPSRILPQCYEFHSFRCYNHKPCNIIRVSPKYGLMLPFGLCVRFQLSCSLLRSEEHTSELQSRFDLVCR